ncbi:MAG: hypothetical protein KKF02_03770 [Proteobacteria bacterium]|nr:hypothetical protein [Pseudomonadota bacterium]
MILIAFDDAAFGLPEIKVGIVGAACFLSRILPQPLVRYMAYSGEPIAAGEMKNLGVILRVVPRDQLFDAAMQIAEQFVQRPPLALRGFKKAMNINEEVRLKEKYLAEIEFTRQLMASEDFQEALHAFMEKRKPVFKGR